MLTCFLFAYHYAPFTQEDMLTTSIIRAMANTLHDHDVDPLNTCEVVIILVQAGFTSKLIHENWEAVCTMALIRKTNEERQ